MEEHFTPTPAACTSRTRELGEFAKRQTHVGPSRDLTVYLYRRYLRRSGEGAAFEIDAGKFAEEARYDGIFVLRTNARLTPLNVVLRYRELLMVESLFQAAKATFDTRPIFHSCDAVIRGHVFCSSFLAPILAKERQGRCARAGLQTEWGRLVRDLDRLQSGVIEKEDKRITVRTPVTGDVGGPVFRAAGFALPSNTADPPRADIAQAPLSPCGAKDHRCAHKHL
ncbi:MAG: hypothetical protein OXI57_01435 [Rhodospirillales bacterium]|nr:hypothetical protein [Rhodospirillales bacterium]